MEKGKPVDDTRSVNSPRRVLSFSKNKRAISFPDPDDRTSGFGVSGEHGPKPAEVYGFLGSISTVVATVIFMVWAYVPDPWLHSLGIFYYPSKYWAVALPAFAAVTVATMLLFYIGLNFMATPPPTSFNIMFDEYSREPSTYAATTEEDERPIDPFSDIGINHINEIMFGDMK